LMINSMFLTLTDVAIRDAVGDRNCGAEEILQFLSADRVGTNGSVRPS
jgi:hypothetical protein